MKDEKPLRAYKSVRARAKELRQEMTPAEKLLWEQLRNRQQGGYKFRRQAPMGTFIADFYCAECKLILEVDGDIHGLQGEYDRRLEACRRPSPCIGRGDGGEG